MDFLKFRKNKGYFEYKDSHGSGMYRLGSLLLDDTGCGSQDFLKKWVAETGNGVMETNVHLILKKAESIVISFQLSKKSEKLIISKKAFLHILDEWEKVCKERPKEVVITRDGDHFTFEKKF